jgi:hypothetical protein
MTLVLAREFSMKFASSQSFGGILFFIGDDVILDDKATSTS